VAQSAKFGFLLFVAALAIRLVGISWGLPGPLRVTSLHPDEPINWMVTRQATDLTPNFYNYGTLYFTIQNLGLGVLHSLGLGVPPSGAGTTAGLAQEILTGRLLSCLAGAGIVWVVWTFLFRRVHWAGALAGSLAVMFAPGMMVHSRFMTVDVIATLFISLSLYWGCEAIREPGLRPYLWAGVFAGLAAACKYNGFLALVAIAPALWASQNRLKQGLVALGATALTFLIGVPGSILEREAFFRDFRYEMWHTGAGHGLVFAGTSPGFVFHWGNLVVAFGVLLTLVGLVGLGRLLYHRSPWALALVGFFVVYFLLIGKAEVKFMRYVFPLIPVLAIGFGWLIGRMHEKKLPWGVALGILSLGLSLDSAMRWTIYMQGEDPRDAAATLIRRLTAGQEWATVGLVSDPWFYTPSFYPETVAPRPVPFDVREGFRLAAKNPSVVRYIPANPDERLDWDVRLITVLEPETIAISSFEEEGYRSLSSRPEGERGEFATAVRRYVRFQDALHKEYIKVAILGVPGLPNVHDLMYVRPTITIWKKKSTSSSTTSPGSGVPATTR